MTREKADEDTDENEDGEECFRIMFVCLELVFEPNSYYDCLNLVLMFVLYSFLFSYYYSFFCSSLSSGNV